MEEKHKNMLMDREPLEVAPKKCRKKNMETRVCLHRGGGISTGEAAQSRHSRNEEKTASQETEDMPGRKGQHRWWGKKKEKETTNLGK